MMESIESEVRGIVARHFGVPASKVRLDAAFIDDLGGDALDLIELVCQFEFTFNITIPLADRQSLVTTRDVIKYLNTHAH